MRVILRALTDFRPSGVDYGRTPNSVLNERAQHQARLSPHRQSLATQGQTCWSEGAAQTQGKLGYPCPASSLSPNAGISAFRSWHRQQVAGLRSAQVKGSRCLSRRAGRCGRSWCNSALPWPRRARRSQLHRHPPRSHKSRLCRRLRLWQIPSGDDAECIGRPQKACPKRTGPRPFGTMFNLIAAYAV